MYFRWTSLRMRPLYQSPSETSLMVRFLITALVATILGLSIPAATAHADIIRLDNNESNPADYRSLQQAIDGASAGDTLYVAGSGDPYETATLNKPLTVIGPGFFFAGNPNAPARAAAAVIEALAIVPGAEGASLVGLTFGLGSYNVPEESGFLISADSITVQRCRFFYHSRSLRRVKIQSSNNVITSVFFEGGTRLIIESGGDNVVSNSHFRFFDELSNAGYTLFKNNVVSFSIQSLNNTYAINNILLNTGRISLNNVTYEHNISEGDQFGSEQGNQSNVQPEVLFVGAEAPSPDAFYQLRVGSPALGAGLNGEDIGMFGGSAPYVLSGLPPIPTITSFDAPVSGTEENGLPINIRIRSNQ